MKINERHLAVLNAVAATSIEGRSASPIVREHADLSPNSCAATLGALMKGGYASHVAVEKGVFYVALTPLGEEARKAGVTPPSPKKRSAKKEKEEAPATPALPSLQDLRKIPAPEIKERWGVSKAELRRMIQGAA